MVLPSSVGLQIQLLNLLNDENEHNLSELRKEIAKKFYTVALCVESDLKTNAQFWTQ